MSYAIAHVPAAQVVYLRFTDVFLHLTPLRTLSPKVRTADGCRRFTVRSSLRSPPICFPCGRFGGGEPLEGLVSIPTPPQSFDFECSRAFDLKSNRVLVCSGAFANAAPSRISSDSHSGFSERASKVGPLPIPDRTRVSMVNFP